MVSLLDTPKRNNMNKPYILTVRFRENNEPVSVEKERQRKVKQIMRSNKLESLNKAVLHAIDSYPQVNS